MNLILHLPDEFLCILITLRRDPDEFDQPFGSIQKTPADSGITGYDIPLVLRPFFRLTDKGPFHVHTDQIRRSLSSGRILFLILRCNSQDLFQFIYRKRHGCRAYRRHTHRRFVLCDLRDRLAGSVTEVIAFTSVEMQVDQSRDRITAASVKYFLSRQSFPGIFPCPRTWRRLNPAVLQHDLSFHEFHLFCVDFHIPNNHIPLSFFFHYLLYITINTPEKS